MKTSNKVSTYFDGVFDKTKLGDPPFVLLNVVHFFLPFLALGLGLWSSHAGGPPWAGTSAHALAWVFIILNALRLGFLMLAGVLRSMLEKSDPVTSDKILFADPRRSNLLRKFTNATATSTYLALAIFSGWPVAITFLVIEFLTDLSCKSVTAWNRKKRLAALDDMTEAQLQDLLRTARKKDEPTGTSALRTRR